MWKCTYGIAATLRGTIAPLPFCPNDAILCWAIWKKKGLSRMKTIVTMTDRGRITLPANVRKELRIEGETPFELETSGEEITLRPAVVIPREDAWAYTPEHRAAIERALQSPIVPNVSEDDLLAITEAEDPQEAARELIQRRLNA
jgi:AbrB family looped-hinge helix DNA binding protein